MSEPEPACRDLLDCIPDHVFDDPVLPASDSPPIKITYDVATHGPHKGKEFVIFKKRNESIVIIPETVMVVRKVSK